MLTRRLMLIAIPAALSPSAALALRALSEQERRALWDIQSHSSQEARRLTGLAANYAALANAQRPSDAASAANLAAVESALRRGVDALNAALGALPRSVRAPTSALQAPAQIGAPQLPARAGVGASRVALARPAQTLEALAASTRFPIRIWGRVAQALRAIDAETNTGLGAAAAHYERARTHLEAANTALGRISPPARIRNDLLDAPQDSAGRLGNYEIRDATAGASQAETLAARTRNALDEAATTLQQNVR